MAAKRAKVICFDLEGPLSPEDNAYELMKLFPGGDRVFEVISRYDDLLALEGKAGYEPGDTLALIAPFLIYHGIAEADISGRAAKAGLVPGALQLISGLHADGWAVFCISTSYQQYASRICSRLGIPRDRLACTAFDLDRYLKRFTESELRVVEEVEEQVKRLSPEQDDPEIKRVLDRFFWGALKDSPLGTVLTEIRPVGGARKVAALTNFAHGCGARLGDWVVIGDSITDARMLEAVSDAEGLSVAFNANQYALPYATMGLASADLSDLRVALQAWEQGGRATAEKAVSEMESRGGEGDRNHFHWLSGREDLEGPLSVHKRIRGIVRQQAGKLG